MKLLGLLSLLGQHSRQESPECDHKTNSPQLWVRIKHHFKGGQMKVVYSFSVRPVYPRVARATIAAIAITGKAAECTEEGWMWLWVNTYTYHF
jgi:hypothetical protein